MAHLQPRPAPSGQLVRAARQRAGLTQADLGARLGVSASTISRVETGRTRTGRDVYVLHRLAQTLGVELTELGVASSVAGVAPVQDDDPMRRRSFLAAGLVVPAGLLGALEDALAVIPEPSAPASPARIAQALGRARRGYDAGRYASVVAALPDLLASAHGAMEAHPDPQTLTTLARVYELAAAVAVKMGRSMTARVAADRATHYARLGGDSVVQASAARELAIVLRHEGRPHLAHTLTLQAAAGIERAGVRTSAHAATYAQMLCTGAYTAAVAEERDQALELLAEARRAAALLPDGGVSGLPFHLTAAAVELYAVGVRWALGDYGEAVATGQRIHPDQFPTPERRARYWTDMARAWQGRGRPEESARALLAAYHQSPDEVRGRPSIRRIATELTERHRELSVVRELSERVGAGA